MMKSRLVLFSLCRTLFVSTVLLSVSALVGCNGIGNKDSLLARIDKEEVFQEDYDLLLKNEGSFRKNVDEVLYDKLYSKAALTSRALSEFPDLEKEWENYLVDMDPRILTMIFQRYYTMECLMFSDLELRRYYGEHRELFASDSNANFFTSRGDVAKKLYIEKNSAKFAEFLKANLGPEDKRTAKDTLDLENSFVLKYQQELRQMLSENILEKRGLSVSSLPAMDPEGFYASHKNLFMTTPGYEVLHVQGKDSLKLESLLAGVTSAEKFKNVVALNSTNSLTKKDSGFIGVVKKGHALPYGIGLVEGLSEELDGKSAGFITKSLKGQDGNFHKFYLVSAVPAKVKEYDRAKPGLVAGIENGEYYDVDSSFVLISKNGQTLLTEGGLLKFNDEFAHLKLNVKKHERLVSMIAENLAFADLAEEHKLKRSWEYRAVVRNARWDFICDKYIDRKRNSNIVPEDSLKSLYERIGSPIHVGYSFEQAIEDLRLVNGLPLNLYRHEYLMGYRMLYVNKTFDESIGAIYSKIKSEYSRLLRERYAAEAYRAATVHLFDVKVAEYEPTVFAESLLARADSLVKAGERTAAYYEYRKLMYAYAEVDSLFGKSAYEMALVQADNEEFLDAEGEYYAYYRMWPQNPNAEKAMFSRGFMLNENLGANDKALEVLEEFLKTYPDSELKESAEWLVKNIKSNGKLAEDLMKKIGSDE